MKSISKNVNFLILILIISVITSKLTKKKLTSTIKNKQACFQHEIGAQSGQYRSWRQDWTVSSSGVRTLSFDARANNDIHVAFSDQNGTNDPMYEIVIGGWNNGRSTIRRRSQGSEICAVNRGFANPGQRSTFTVTLNEDQRRITVNQGQDTILDCTDSNFIRNLRFFDFSSWNTPITYWINCLQSSPTRRKNCRK